MLFVIAAVAAVLAFRPGRGVWLGEGAVGGGSGTV